MTHEITTQWLESIVNRYLALDPEGMSNLAALKGKIICVDVLGLNRQYYVLPGDERIAIQLSSETEPDTTIRGLPSALSLVTCKLQS